MIMKCVTCGNAAEYIYCGQSLCAKCFKVKAAQVDKLIEKSNDKG